MPSHDDRPGPWSRLLNSATTARDTAQRRLEARFARLPRPAQQTGRLVHRTGRATVDDRVPGLAAEAALFTLISLPALLLAIIGSLGFVASTLSPEGTDRLRSLVLEVPRSFLTDPTYASYEETVDTVLNSTRGGVVSLGIVLSIWTGSRAVNRYLETITIAYNVDQRAGWRRRLLALGLTIGLLVGAVSVLPPLVLGPQILDWLLPDGVADATLRLAELMFWPAVALLVTVGLATLYHVGVPWRTPWRRDVPGAILALVLWLLASAALRAYLTLSIQADAVFAQLAVPIAVVLWLYITAFAVLLGAEFNAEIEKMWPHKEYPWRLRCILSRKRTGASSSP
ncbi:YihY/virulence factor BrkB family protein [Mycobacterium sp. SMC-4]|uniref:YihY/virulence factor BrkB family protein n=1 Tax=Mycobacterium sp. SMC-4 TaxID=2857059 RepID=UPI0021B43DB0|nr:YihY/virulence factor BrkB family protein [Mycobacterium sp. SMC-4]UXA17003.1 YihY/virulence factor BrkB family protein [Mycobacterium sp. SMC-4]